ncbi:MAG: amidohydrolase [Gemmatimonadota bacterium]
MTTRSLALRILLALSCALAACSAGDDRPADLVVYGRIWTGDTARPWASALAVSGDTIRLVGDSAEVAALVGKETTVIAEPGAMVVPGFTDGHLHLTSGGMALGSVDLRDAASPAEFIARIRTHAAALGPGQWVLGGRWDHERWPGSPLPSRQWIDSATPDRPVLIYRLDGHMALANSAALEAAGVTRATPDVAGGEIARDAAGEPTGILRDAAIGLVSSRVPPPAPEQVDSAVARALRYLAERGITSFASVSAPWEELAALDRLRKAGRLTARATLFFPLEHWRAVADTVAARGRGDDWIRLGGVKGYADGSLGSQTALFYEPYAQNPRTSGLLVTPEDSLRRWIGSADSAGLQVVVHAIGERANGLVLAIYDSVNRAHGPRDRRFRIEHAQHLRPADLVRFGQSRVIASMQPIHLTDDGRWAAKRLGPERATHSYQFRTLLDQHAVVVFGSDWPVAAADPVLGIAAAVTRRLWDGSMPAGWIPEQRIGVEEALRAYTAANAYGVFAEGRTGVLRPGARADLVVLGRDLTAISPDSIGSTPVLRTVVGGKEVYRR